MQKLKSFTVQAESHKYLDKIKDKHQLAECRINPESDEPYEVWDEPDPRSRGLTPINTEET